MLRLFVSRRGLANCTLLAARHVAKLVSQQIYLHERHIWYALRVAKTTPLGLNGGQALYRGDERDIEGLSKSSLCSGMTARRYLDAGGQLWIVRDEAGLAFCCWIFMGRMPVLAAPGGWQPLPPKMACLEGSVTSQQYRGRGIAPAVWSLLAQGLRIEGTETIITKVEEENTASRKAVFKAGFSEMAVMDYRRVTGLSRLSLEAPTPRQWPNLNALFRNLSAEPDARA